MTCRHDFVCIICTLVSYSHYWLYLILKHTLGCFSYLKHAIFASQTTHAIYDEYCKVISRLGKQITHDNILK
uniref:Uncharacterized protein n=1 Tax=Arundo donax TaxID=35708 RepID=A0A0A9ESN1_ARUDO